MPVRLNPLPGETIATKKVTPGEWESEGPFAEWFEILDYLRSEVLDTARAAGRKTIQQGRTTKEEFVESAFQTSLFTAQVKGWRLLDPKGVEIPFTPENLARLPAGLREWLQTSILECGGVIPTASLEVATASGQTFQLPGADAELDPAGVDGLPDQERAAVVR